MKCYLDSNVFIYYEISSGINRELSGGVLKLMESGKIGGFTSCLTIDEVVWIVSKHIDKETGIKVGKKMMEEIDKM